MERVLLLEKLKELYLKQRDYAEAEQWDFWETTVQAIEEFHDELSGINDKKGLSHTEQQLVNDIAELYTVIKTELENKLKQTGNELSKVDKDLAKLRDNRMKLLELHNTFSDVLSDSGGTVLNARC